MRKRQIPLLNLVTEPVSTASILRAYFPDKQVGANCGAAVHYDLRTRHSGLFQGDTGYRFTSAEVMNLLGAFIRSASVGAAA